MEQKIGQDTITLLFTKSTAFSMDALQRPFRMAPIHNCRHFKKLYQSKLNSRKMLLNVVIYLAFDPQQKKKQICQQIQAYVCTDRRSFKPFQI